jgi:hypothetical protein
VNPTYFLDIRALRGGPLTPAKTLAGAVATLHAKGVLSGGQVALAFPQATQGELPSPGFLLRAWASTAEALEQAKAAIQPQESISIGKIEHLPHWQGEWRGYFRYRVPSRRQKDQSPERLAARARRRAHRLSASDHMPYLNIQSLSGKQSFRLFIDIQQGESGLESDPNSYGLASVDRPFFLPHF